jgi:hypothetical protein
MPADLDLLKGLWNELGIVQAPSPKSNGSKGKEQANQELAEAPED